MPDKPFSSAKRCWAEVDPAAIRSNAGFLRKHLGERAGIMAVVKADAYGHGLEIVARALAPLVQMFGVACLREAVALREAVPGARVLLLSTPLPEERAEVVWHGFETVVSSVDEARAFGAFERAGGPARVHLVADTGMGRLGVREEGVVEAFEVIRKVAGVEIAGICTHLPCADEDPEFTRTQLERYTRLVGLLRSVAPEIPLSHSLNSAGALLFPEYAPDLVRAGLMLYGVSPVPGFDNALRPALSMKARVTVVREVAAGTGISYGRTFVAPKAMRVATLSAGYADGYPRHLSNKGASVLIGGKRCPLLGRVTMDQVVVDVTGVPEAGAGDEVVLLGKQGNEEIGASELARLAGTIPWEIFTGMQCRDGRVLSL